MRVAFLSPQWPGLRMGGIGSYVSHAAAALAASGHDPHVFTLGDGGPVDVPPGVTLHQTPDLAARVHSGTTSAELAAAVHVGGPAVYRLSIARLLTAALLREHARRPFDVAEAADVDAVGLPLLLDPGRPVPVVVHLHTCSAIANRINGVPPGDGQGLVEAMESAQVHLADAVCAPTRAVVRSTREVMPVGAEPTLVPHAFAGPAGPFRPPPADGPVVFVGRLEWRKGCGVLAAALNQVLARHPTVRFEFVGPDTDSAPGGGSVHQHVASALSPAVADRVAFAGERSPADVAAHLANCRFVVLPSLSENFSLALCEAMAAGRTAVVAEGTGSAEVLGSAGVTVPAGSADRLAAAMDRLLADPDRLATLSRAAYRRVRDLCDPAATSERRVECYRRTIAAFSPRTDRLATLPPGVAAAVLPCLSRLVGGLVGMPTGSPSPGQRLGAICGRLGPTAHVLLYGAGKHTARLLSERHAWESAGHRVVGLIDDHPRFAVEPTLLGLPVRTLAATEAEAAAGHAVPPVVLSTDTYQGQFWARTAGLRGRGVPVFKLYEGA